MLTLQALSTNATKADAKKSIISRYFNREIHLNYLIVIVALYLVATANMSFFEQVLNIYPFSSNIGFMISITGLLFGLIWLVLQLLCYRPIAKLVLIALILIAAICGYFTDGYGTFPAKKPDYDAAFVFIDDEYNNYDVPPWAIKLVLQKDEI